MDEKFKPAKRVAGQKQDVWSIVNEAAAASPKQPIVNMGQGFFGYNPPQFVIDAAKSALDRVDCNQYSPTKGRPRLKKAIADAYSPFFGRTLDPETEITITTGANEGMLSAFMGFIEPGDEVIIFEPFFDQYLSNIEMPGGKIRYVPDESPSRRRYKDIIRLQLANRLGHPRKEHQRKNQNDCPQLPTQSRRQSLQ